MRTNVSRSMARLSDTVAGWKTLRTLRAVAIDLTRVALIRERDISRLQDVDQVTALIEELGLNDEGLEEYPAELRPFCGQGLRIWQYPRQLGRYLVDLANLNIRSYLEIGIRHGGTFVATVEYLQRFGPLDLALGIDLLPSPSMTAYSQMNPTARFVRINTQSDEFTQLLHKHPNLDLVFIDSFHQEQQRRREVEAVLGRARAIAVHDIAHDDLPGLRNAWNELKAMSEFECREYVEQYPSLGRSFMGIGLAIRRWP